MSGEVSIDPDALKGVIGGLETSSKRIDQHIGPLRHRLVQLGLSTSHLDKLTGAAEQIDKVLPDLRQREGQAREIARTRPGVKKVRLTADIRTPGQEAAYGKDSTQYTQVFDPAAGTTQLWFGVGDDTTVEDQTAEPKPPEDPPLLSVGGLKKVGGDLLSWGKSKLDKLKEWAVGQWNDLMDTLSGMWDDLASWWDEQTARLGGWIDENLDGVRQWIGRHAGIFRVLAQVLKIVGWVLVVVGAVLFVVGLVLDATGIGAIVGLPTGAAALAIMSGGFLLVGAGDALDTLADWGEGKIDGQQLVQALAAEIGLTALSLVGLGILGKGASKLIKHLPDAWVKKLDDFIKKHFIKPRPKHAFDPRKGWAGVPAKEIKKFRRLSQKNVKDLTPSEAAYLKKLRDSITAPSGTPMQRTISPEQMRDYLRNSSGDPRFRTDESFGFTSRQVDVEHFKTPEEMFRGLGLDYPGTKFKDGNKVVDEIPFIRYKQPMDSAPEIPRHSSLGGSGSRDADAIDPKNPFTGNGWTKGDDPIPEFHTGSKPVKLQEGSELWTTNSKGQQTLVAVLKDVNGKVEWVKR